MKEHECNKRPNLSYEQEHFLNGFLATCGETGDKVFFVNEKEYKGAILTDGEYFCVVNFCPYCGIEIKE